jgi:hypothetical protein
MKLQLSKQFMRGVRKIHHHQSLVSQTFSRSENQGRTDSSSDVFHMLAIINSCLMFILIFDHVNIHHIHHIHYIHHIHHIHHFHHIHHIHHIHLIHHIHHIQHIHHIHHHHHHRHQWPVLGGRSVQRTMARDGRFEFSPFTPSLASRNAACDLALGGYHGCNMV